LKSCRERQIIYQISFSIEFTLKKSFTLIISVLHAFSALSEFNKAPEVRQSGTLGYGWKGRLALKGRNRKGIIWNVVAAFSGVKFCF